MEKIHVPQNFSLRLFLDTFSRYVDDYNIFTG